MNGIGGKTLFQKYYNFKEEIIICLQIPKKEFQKNGENWVLDVRFTKPHNEEESFASKTDKY